MARGYSNDYLKADGGRNGRKVAYFLRVAELNNQPLLARIQQAAISKQIREKVGWKVWRELFKGCVYEAEEDRLTLNCSN